MRLQELLRIIQTSRVIFCFFDTARYLTVTGANQSLCNNLNECENKNYMNLLWTDDMNTTMQSRVIISWDILSTTCLRSFHTTNTYKLNLPNSITADNPRKSNCWKGRKDSATLTNSSPLMNSIKSLTWFAVVEMQPPKYKNIHLMELELS